MALTALLGPPGATSLAAQSNSVSVAPPSQVVAGAGTVTVTVTWCGYPGTPQNYMDIYSRVITVNGVDVTGDFDLQFNQAACGFSGPVGDEVLYTSTGTVTVNQSTGPVTVSADVSNSYGYHWMAAQTYYPLAPRRAVRVVAEQQFVTPAPGARQERFTVTNVGTGADSYALSPALECSGLAVTGGCTVSPTTLSLAAGASGAVTVSYTASATAGQRGLVRLRAVSSADATVRDSSWTDVTVASTPAVGVAIVGTAPGRGDLFPRDACVTVALTDGAASECGDLRLVHALPAVRTMGTARAPTLLYTSQHARPKPIVLADVRLSSGVALPPNVTACIKIAGVSRGCATWTGASWGSPGNTRRVAVLGDDGTWNTGEIDYTLEVTASNGAQGPYSATGRLLVVNRTASMFGAGWWLAGLEQLQVISATDLLWIGGDGSARRYVKSGTVWKAPNFAGLDSIQAAGTGYVRKTAEQARVHFDASGRHDSTVNALRHVTKFVYASGLLTRIQLPTPGGFVDDSLFYTSGRLDSVKTPGPRGVKLFATAARLDSIRDPDGQVVRFTSGAGLNQYVVTARKDRRGNTTTFAYDAGNRLSQAARPLSSTIGLASAETKGLSAPVLVDSAFTQVDGPRTDVTDVSRFWLNGYGAPVRTRTAVGQETFVRYSATWPGLADSVMGPSRLVSTAVYNARGLPTTVRVVQPYGTAGDAVTTYQWHSALNRPTSARTLTSGSATLLDSTSFNADSTVAWTQHGTGAGPRVTYTYTANRLPLTLVLPGNAGAETTTFSYSALGNLRKEQNPLGALTLRFEDAAGRDTLVVAPRGTGTSATDSTTLLSAGVRQRTLYDRMSRDTLAQTTGPAVTLPNSRVVPADTVRVRSTYDAEGNRLTATRSYTRKLDATQGGLYQMQPSEWVYDALNRVTQQRDAGRNWTTLTLDPAGNATATLTPRGDTIRATYDAANRVTRRIVPQVTYAGSACHYQLSVGYCAYTFPTFEGSSLCIAVDTSRFAYDEGGNVRSAENNWAKVRRAYAPNGALLYDTLRTRRYDTEAPGSCGGGDRHGVGESALASDWAAHVYALRYEYDLAGRRTKLYHPNQLDPCSGVSCQQLYQYSAVTGTLDALVHPSATGGTLTTQFTYDNQFRLATSVHPGPVSVVRTYDAGGRLATRVGSLTNDNLTYDAADKLIGGTTVLPASQTTQTLSLGYGGLGALQWAQGAAAGITYEEYKTDALGNRLWVRDPDAIDGVDRTKYHAIAADNGQLVASALGTPICAAPGATQRSCHPSWYYFEDNQSHDLAGNVSETWQKDTRGSSAGTASQVPSETRSYYDAADRLTYFNRQVGLSLPGEGGGVFEEYRYDALGRRVYVRSRRPSTCASPCEAFVQRTVWDGDQVLYEIRSSGQTGTSATYTDSEGAVAPGDDANLYGIVAYAHASGVDQPIGLLKQYAGSYGGSGTWGYLTPHANYQGDWSYGTFSTGATCTTVGAACPNWPGYAVNMDGAGQGPDVPSYTVWWGDVIRGATTTGGPQYLRNRYYDARTGRFTQQDPIGLAGGVNLYGFANGDPVSYSDPFGLCPYKDDLLCKLFEGSVTLLGGTAGFIGGGGLGLLEIAGTGGLATPAAVATAAGGTALGAEVGRRVGQSLSNVLFSKRDAGGGGGENRALSNWSRKHGLNANSETTQNLFDNRGMRVSDFIAKFRKGGIREVFPGEFMDKTLDEALREGGSTVRKLLIDGRFVR